MRRIVEVGVRLVQVVALAFATVTLVGCNTTEGAGRDIEAAGDAIADTARDAKD